MNLPKFNPKVKTGLEDLLQPLPLPSVCVAPSNTMKLIVLSLALVGATAFTPSVVRPLRVR